MKFLIFKRNGEQIGEKLNSYESEFKDDTSRNRPEDQAEPKAIHIQLPEGLDEDCVKPQWMELQPEQTVTLREPIQAQSEKWVKDEQEVFEQPMVVSEDPELEGALIPDESWSYIPAIEAQDGLYQQIPAVFGWGLAIDENSLAAKQEYESKATARYIKTVVEAAKAFGENLMNDFTVENVMMGITQDGMTSHVRKAMTEVILALTTGSLYDAIDEAKAIPEIQKDPKYITDARLLSFINKIETYLGQPLTETL